MPKTSLQGARQSPRPIANQDTGPQSERRAPIVLLVSHSPLANIIVNGLIRRLGPLVVIREAPESKVEVVRRRARLLGWPAALGQLGFGLLQRLLITGKCRNSEIWSTHGLDPTVLPAATVIEVSSVNSPDCHALLRRLSPRVVGVYGTRILARATLRTVSAPFINYHAGINPKYRGQHPMYWALASGDPDNAGVTVHLVDSGVDTGDVLYQAAVPFDARDTIATYQHLQAAYALPLFARALQDGLENTLYPKRVALPSRQWFPPTLWRYLITGLTQKVW
jgi:folate-dependent phosphoribosylglycinamide formyltransferase PurN